MTERPVFVLLGASNFELALPDVVEALGRRVDGPFDVLAAIGHGRSYGTTSRYLARELPSIAESGLWGALDAMRPRTLRALVADAGNDLMYGVDAARVTQWIATSVAQLDRLGAEVAIVGLPRARLERVTPFGFALLSTLVFPFHPRRALEATRAEARALDEGLRALAGERPFVEPPLEWYGLDPIHVRPRARAAAWETIAASFGPPRRPGWRLAGRERRALRAAHAERRALFGTWRRTPQPSVRLDDGSTFAAY
ncbi:MAG: hypothetical protein IPJ77_02665 [Planctomycetes bacterium]|nr:hypothetical protein [Planctomycetota bacterium]